MIIRAIHINDEHGRSCGGSRVVLLYFSRGKYSERKSQEILRQKILRLYVYKKQRETRDWKKLQKKLEFNFAQIICKVTSEKLKIYLEFFFLLFSGDLRIIGGKKTQDNVHFIGLPLGLYSSRPGSRSIGRTGGLVETDRTTGRSNTLGPRFGQLVL